MSTDRDFLFDLVNRSVGLDRREVSRLRAIARGIGEHYTTPPLTRRSRETVDFDTERLTDYEQAVEAHKLQKPVDQFGARQLMTRVIDPATSQALTTSETDAIAQQMLNPQRRPLGIAQGDDGTKPDSVAAHALANPLSGIASDNDFEKAYARRHKVEQRPGTVMPLPQIGVDRGDDVWAKDGMYIDPSRQIANVVRDQKLIGGPENPNNVIWLVYYTYRDDATRMVTSYGDDLSTPLLEFTGEATPELVDAINAQLALQDNRPAVEWENW